MQAVFRYWANKSWKGKIADCPVYTLPTTDALPPSKDFGLTHINVLVGNNNAGLKVFVEENFHVLNETSNPEISVHDYDLRADLNTSKTFKNDEALKIKNFLSTLELM